MFIVKILLLLSLISCSLTNGKDINNRRKMEANTSVNLEQNGNSRSSSHAVQLIPNISEYLSDEQGEGIMILRKMVSDITNAIPVNVGGNLFPQSEIDEMATLYGLDNNVAGCGPVAMIGMYDYFAREQIIGEYTEQLVFDNITFYDDSDNTHTHIFQYSALNSSTHSINCRCGYSSVGNHAFELNKLNSIVTDPQYIPSYVCSFCGYTTNRLPTIL